MSVLRKVQVKKNAGRGGSRSLKEHNTGKVFSIQNVML